MQGWRSIMHGSPQQGSSTRISAVAAQKNGLDLAWRLNGMPPHQSYKFVWHFSPLSHAAVHSIWSLHCPLWRPFQTCIKRPGWRLLLKDGM